MYTILGANGFIGSHLVKFLRENNLPCYTPERNDKDIFLKNLGDVFYCIGLTADFRYRPFDTVEAHVSHFNNLVRNAKYDKILYLSSTRIYLNAQDTNENSTIFSSNILDIYNLSKLMGESICINSHNDNIKIARISNPLGRDFSCPTFFYELCNGTKKSKQINLRENINSMRDYISVEDVAKLLFLIQNNGKRKIYNVASGINIKNKDIIEIIKRKTGFALLEENTAGLNVFPVIDTSLINNEFKLDLRDPLNTMEALVNDFFD